MMKNKTKATRIDEPKASGSNYSGAAQPADHQFTNWDRMPPQMVSIFNAIPHAVLVIKDRRILFSNQAVERDFGWKYDETAGQPISILYRTNQEYEEIFNRFDSILPGRKLLAGEFYCRHKDGRNILCRISASTSPELHSAGINIVTYEEISERENSDNKLKRHPDETTESRTRKLAEINQLLAREIAERKQAEALYKILAEQSLAAVFIVRNHKFCFMNPSAVSSSGYAACELVGNDSDCLIYPEDRKLVRTHARNMLMGRSSAPYEFRAVTREGQIRWIMQVVAAIEYEGSPAILGNAMDITDFKQASEALRESEEKFRMMSASAQDAIILMDNEGRISFCNEAAERMFDYSSSEMLGMDCQTLIAPRSCRKATQNGISQFRNSGLGFAVGKTLELEGLKKDGTEFPVELSLSATRLKGKWCAIGIIRDISERKRVEASLRESENRLADIINFLPDATFVIDSAGRVTAWNRAIEEMTGVSAKFMLGKGHYEYALPFYGSRRPILIDLILKPDIEVEQGYSFVQKLKDTLLAEVYASVKGQRRALWMIASPLYDCRGGIVGAVESVRDITEHKRVEAALRESEDKFRVLSEKSGVGICLIQNGAFQYINPKGAEICGYSAEELADTGSFENIVVQEDWPLVSKNLDRCISGDAGGFPFEFKIVRKNKDIIFVETHGSRIIYNNRPAVISTIIDISDRKRVEAERRHREKLQGILEMAGTICHEMNQPMQIISGYSELLQRNNEADKAIREKLDVIYQQILRMSLITKKLMFLDQCETKDYAGFGRIIDIHQNSGKDE